HRKPTILYQMMLALGPSRVRPQTLWEILERNAAARSKGAAVTDSRGTLDWETFTRLSEGYAGFLSRQGLGFGDRVALWLPNCTDYFALIFACARIGALAVHVNTRFRAAEVGYLLRRARPAAVITTFNFEPVDF